MATFCLGLWQGTALASDPLAPAEDAAGAATSGDVAGAAPEAVETEAAAATGEEESAVTDPEPVDEAPAESASTPADGPAEVEEAEAAGPTQDVATDVSETTEQAAASQATEPAAPAGDEPVAATEEGGGGQSSPAASTQPTSGAAEAPATANDGGATSASSAVGQHVASGSAAVVQETSDVAGSAGAVNDEVEALAESVGADDTAVAGTSALEEAAQVTTDTVSTTTSEAAQPIPITEAADDVTVTNGVPVLLPIADGADPSDAVADGTPEVLPMKETPNGQSGAVVSDGVDQLATVAGIALDSLTSPAGNASSVASTETVDVATGDVVTSVSNVTRDAAASAFESTTAAVGEETGASAGVAASLEASPSPVSLVPDLPEDGVSADPVHTLAQLVLAPAPTVEQVPGGSASSVAAIDTATQVDVSGIATGLVDEAPAGGATQAVGAAASTSSLGATGEDLDDSAGMAATDLAEQGSGLASFGSPPKDSVVVAPSSTTHATVASPLSLANEDTNSQGSAFPEELVSLPGAEAMGVLGTPQGDGDGRVRFAPSAAAFVRREVLRMNAAEAAALMGGRVPASTQVGSVSWTPGWLPFTGFVLLLPLAGGALLLMTGGRVALWFGKRATG